MPFPQERPRRLRRTEALRSLVRETTLSPDDLVWPLFVLPGQRVRNPVKSMPGVFQLSVDELVAECQAGFEAGVRSVILFGIPASKDAVGSGAYADDGIVPTRGEGAQGAAPRPGGDDRRLPLRVHRPRPLRRAAAARGRRPRAGADGRQRPHPAAAGPRGGGPRPRRRRRGGAVGHDGRPGGGDPGRARPGRLLRPAHPLLRRQVRRGLLRPVPRRRRERAARGAGRSPGTARPTRWTRPTCARRCARWRWTWPRGPTW